MKIHNAVCVGLTSKILRTSLLFALALGVTAEVRAQLPNAWQITDDSTTAALHYTNQLDSAQMIATTNSGFDFSVNARLVADLGGPQTMTMAYGLGNHRFLVWWNLDANGDLTADVEGDNTYTLTTNGTGTTLYHTHEILYNPTNGTATYLFDGQVVASNWPGRVITFPAGEVYWGAGSGAGRGQMNFHSVSFSISNQVVAGYNAGTEPANAPDPDSQGWTLSPSAPPAGTGTNAISPDPVPLPTTPVATTLDATNVNPQTAKLRGLVNQGNLAATVWFEWGTDNNYGNITPPRPLLSDTNDFDFSQTITGLAKQTTYHFRCVATNLLGIIHGADSVFTTPLSFVVTTLADSGAGSLRQALADAQAGDTITFATNGVINLTSGPLIVTNNLTIAGPGPANLAINGNAQFTILDITTNSDVTLDSLTLTNGYASLPGGGGGILVEGGATLVVSNCSVNGNSANSSVANSPGGGIYNSGTLTINNSTLSGNSASGGYGGGIANGGTLTINNSTLSGNSASGGYGGGMINGGTLTINNSTLSDNSAGAGGAIFSALGTLTIYNSTLSGNSALGGGGVYNQATNLLNNCTVSSNSAGTGGGIVQDTTGMTTLTNTIVAGNTATNTPDLYGAPGSVSAVNSLTNGDPLLAPLGNYGGPTQTAPPMFGSPAIDAGDDSVTDFLIRDQRGYLRKRGAHVDIGAVELQPAPDNVSPLLVPALASESGAFQFSFTDVPYVDFTVLSSTNVALPLPQWTRLGSTTRNSSGQYQFTDPDATNYPQRFYRVTSP